MFPQISKRVKIFALPSFLCVLLFVGGLYLYHQHTASPVQERVYVVPERSERQPATTFQTAPVHSTSHTYAAEEPPYENTDSAHDYQSEVAAGVGESESFVVDDSAPEDISSTSNMPDAEKARIDDLAAQVEKLTNAICNKYPEIVQLTTVSSAEFDELYPTVEDRVELEQRLEKAHREFLFEFRSLFLQLPADVREESLSEAHDHFTAYMGEGMADAIMTEVRSQLGL